MVNPDCRADPTLALSQAIDLIAAGDPEAALPLLEGVDLDHPDAAAALAAIRLAQHRPADALAALDRAIEIEPGFPLHHWNAAVALHQLGDLHGCYHAMRRFLATSAAPTGLAADPAQPARLARATQLIAELERTARLRGTSLDQPRRNYR